MDFERYQHVVKLGQDEVEGIEVGLDSLLSTPCRVREKVPT